MPYADPKAKRERDRLYREANRERRASAQRVYYQRNRPREDVRNAGYLRARPGLHRAIRFANASNRRAAARGVPGKLLGRDVVLIDGACTYCAGEATGWDHVEPLALGGPNEIGNIVRCCLWCNKSKGSKRVHVWRPSDADTVLERLARR